VRKGKASVTTGVARAVEAAPQAHATTADQPYDEMRGQAGAVRPHYVELAERIATLSADELAERQRTLERFFLLQGITFTV
jgi:uncharacterized circularly permuted ATP-grasp superfamily protein